MKMRIYVGLVLFLYVNSVCGFTPNQTLERLKYVDYRIDTEGKFRRGDYSLLLNGIESIKTMLYKSLEHKVERNKSDSVQSTDKTRAELENDVQMLETSFKQEKTLNSRSKQELQELQRNVKSLETKTDQIPASLEDILKGIEFLKEEKKEIEETSSLLQNEIPEIQNNIVDLHELLEQTKVAKSDNINRIKVDTEEMKEHFNYITTKFDQRECNCSVSSCPVTSTPQDDLMTLYSSSTAAPDHLMTADNSGTSPHTLLTTYKSCKDLYDNGFETDAVYEIKLEQEGIISVYCDMTTDGGGWTVFQRRQDGSVDFFRDWNDYRAGFGNLTGEFWLGNEYLNILTDNDKPHELRVELGAHYGVRAYAKYSSFKVGSERLNYRLQVSGYGGSAGDSLFAPSIGYSSHFGPHDGMQFSTKDVDNDKANMNCASHYKGGWWFNNCFDSHLNAPYQDQPECKVRRQCITWHMFKAPSYALKFTEMKFR